MKSIVLFVEGEGESLALPKLVKRILTELNAWGSDSVYLDEKPFRVGHVTKLLKADCREWKRKLAASTKRHNLGGVLLVLDGDLKRSGANPFCACNVAGFLASEARMVGGGSTFSVAIVFACQEYESWLLAGAASFAGKRLPDGRLIVSNAEAPAGNLEESPRDAKGAIGRFIEGGYKPSRDQEALTKLVDLEVIRNRKLRSFQRLESAVLELTAAIRVGRHVVTPLLSGQSDT